MVYLAGLHVTLSLAGGPLGGVDGGGHSEEAPLAGRHEEVVGVQDRRVGQQEVLQLHMLVLAPGNDGGKIQGLEKVGPRLGEFFRQLEATAVTKFT